MHLVAAAIPNVSLIHMEMADTYGNIQSPRVSPFPNVDLTIAKAARRLVVSVEEVVPHKKIREKPEKTIIPAYKVDAVVHTPQGAFPGAFQNRYKQDEKHLQSYVFYASNPAFFGKYLEKYVY